MRSFRAFRRICDEIFAELKRIDAFLTQGGVSDEGLEVVTEVEQRLEQLYGCAWGQGEALKRLVVAVQSQVNNVRWTRQHVDFLKDVVGILRTRYLVDDRTVNDCFELMKARGLNPFRGTVCEPRVIKKYRIQEVSGPIVDNN